MHTAPVGFSFAAAAPGKIPGGNWMSLLSANFSQENRTVLRGQPLPQFATMGVEVFHHQAGAPLLLRRV